jgi:hypothetical protein
MLRRAEQEHTIALLSYSMLILRPNSSVTFRDIERRLDLAVLRAPGRPRCARASDPGGAGELAG